jgi:predicted aspartyl protease
MKHRMAALAALGLLASCVVMKPVTPTPDLRPVAIGGPAGSLQTSVDIDASPYAPLTFSGTALLVRPLVNGVDVGWFVLDTGATGMVISSAAARKAGLAAIGTTRLQDGSVTTVFRGETFQLGPLTLRGTKYAGADFPYGKMTFGRPVEGFCGYDVFARTVFELDIGGGRIGVWDPATYALDDGRWQDLVLDANLPHAWCRFEGGREGLFLLDAGYDGSVQLFPHVVEQYGLLEGRRTRARTVLSFGAQTIVRQGTLDWFEIGSTRLEEVETHFASGPSQLYPGSALTAGIVGADLMRRFRVVLDYGHDRVVLIPGTMEPIE